MIEKTISGKFKKYDSQYALQLHFFYYLQKLGIENIKVFQKLVKGKAMASKLNSNLITDAIKYDKPITVQTAINALEKTDKALNNARKLNAPVKKIRV